MSTFLAFVKWPEPEFLLLFFFQRWSAEVKGVGIATHGEVLFQFPGCLHYGIGQRWTVGGQRHVLNDQSLIMTIVSTAWSLTVVGTSNPWPLAEPSCSGLGTKIGGPGDVLAFMAIAVGAWSIPTTGTISSGEILKSTRLFQWNVVEKNSVTHFARLSELESISIDNGVGARDKYRREDSDKFFFLYSATSRMRLDSDSLLLDMIVKRESCSVRFPR